MLKCRGKCVCRHICAKSVRLALEPYSQYLLSRGYSPKTRQAYICAVKYLGGGWDGGRLAGPMFGSSSIRGCLLANVRD